MARDFLEIVVHFVVSALVGALVVCLLLLPLSFAWGFAYTAWPNLGAALVYGIAGAVLGEDFWESGWNPLRWLTYWWW